MIFNPSRTINWKDVAIETLSGLQSALRPIQTKHEYARKGYTTFSGVRLDRVFGVTIALSGAEFEWNTNDFCRRIIDPAVASIARHIKEAKTSEDCILESATLLLPSGCLVAENCTDPGKLSVRITCVIDPVEHTGDPVEGCIEHYDIVNDRRYLVAPPFIYLFRVELLGGFAKKKISQAA